MTAIVAHCTNLSMDTRSSPTDDILLLTDSSFLTIPTMISNEDNTSGTIVSNPFFTEQALKLADSTEVITLALAVRATPNKKYNFPAFFNKELGYMTMCIDEDGDIAYFPFKQPADLCYFQFVGGKCTPRAGTKCQRLHHVKHALPGADSAKAREMWLCDYMEHLKAILKTSYSEPTQIELPVTNVEEVTETVRPHTPAAVPVPFIGDDDEFMLELDPTADSEVYDQFPEPYVKPTDLPFTATLNDNRFSPLMETVDNSSVAEVEVVEVVEQCCPISEAPAQSPVSLEEANDAYLEEQYALAVQHKAESISTFANRNVLTPEEVDSIKSGVDDMMALVGGNCNLDINSSNAIEVATRALRFLREETALPMPAARKTPINSEEATTRRDVRRIETLETFAALIRFLESSKLPVLRGFFEVNKHMMMQLNSYWKGQSRNARQDKAMTEYCAYTKLFGKCLFGKPCTFAHNEKELRPSIDQFINIVVLRLLAAKSIDMQMVIEQFVQHFMQDDMIQLVDAVFDCVNRYTQETGKKPPREIYIDENCLNAMLFEKNHPATNPKKGLGKHYLPHLLTLYKTIYTFLTSEAMKGCRDTYPHYNFSGKLDLLEIYDAQGDCLRDPLSGLPVSNIVRSLVWCYNQCPRNRRFPYNEMAFKSVSSRHVRAAIGCMSKQYKDVINELFDWSNYCMAGHLGCEHGSHAVYDRKDESFNLETLLNMDQFFGIEAPKFDQIEFGRLTRQRDSIMLSYEITFEDLVRHINANGPDMKAYTQFINSCKDTKKTKAIIGKLSKEIEDLNRDIANHKDLIKKSKDVEAYRLRTEEIHALTTQIGRAESLAESSSGVKRAAARTEVRRLTSTRSGLMKLNTEIDNIGDATMKLERLESKIAAKQSELMAKQFKPEHDAGMVEMKSMYRRLHGLDLQFKEVTAALLKVSPRRGNCLVNTLGFEPLRWWSDNHVAKKSVSSGIEVVARVEVAPMPTNSLELSAPRNALAIMGTALASYSADTPALESATRLFALTNGSCESATESAYPVLPIDEHRAAVSKAVQERRQNDSPFSGMSFPALASIPESVLALTSGQSWSTVAAAAPSVAAVEQKAERPSAPRKYVTLSRSHASNGDFVEDDYYDEADSMPSFNDY